MGNSSVADEGGRSSDAQRAPPGPDDHTRVDVHAPGCPDRRALGHLEASTLPMFEKMLW